MLTEEEMNLDEESSLVLSEDGRTLESVDDPFLTFCKIPYGVWRIEDNAFAGCLELKMVIIPDTVTTIGEGAFTGCKKLDCIVLPESVEEIGEDCFSGCDRLRNIAVDGNNPYFKDIYGVLFSKDEKAIIKFPSAHNAHTCYGIPEGVDFIFSGAFINCSFLEAIWIPQSITYISDSAFYDCQNLENVYFPAGLESIGEFAFAKCRKLQSLSLPDSLESIGEFAFTGCNSLRSVVLPQSLSCLHTEAFSNCENLRTVRIRSGVCLIGSRIFVNCWNLRDIYIEVEDPSCIEMESDGDQNYLMDVVTLHVPEDSMQLYLEHPYFCSFFKIVAIAKE